MSDWRYAIQHWWWRLTHPGQWMAARRYERTAGKTPPPEWWEEARKHPPTSGYCQRHKRAEPLDSWCHNEAAPMSPERRERLLGHRVYFQTWPEVTVTLMFGGYVASMSRVGITESAQTPGEAYDACVRAYHEWLADDAIADEELRTGKVRRFDDVRDAIAWLEADDE